MSSSSTPNLDHESKYSRKEKSLGLLCTNFLKLYGRDGVDSLGIDDAALRLGVEKRRIYDIVNILERIGPCSEMWTVFGVFVKNQYRWEGFSGIPRALENLKQQGIKDNFSASIAKTFEQVVDENGGSEIRRSDSTNQNIVSERKTVVVNRKEKSLGLLTENFIMLLLCSDVELITLDYAASVLLGDDCNRSSAKSNHSAAKVRRLYDIANVFTAMNLIEKVRHSESGKSAFRWIGPVKSIRNRSTLGNEKDNTRTFGREINLKNGSTSGSDNDNTRIIGTEINLKNGSTSGSEKDNKRKFGTEITNTVNKKCKVASPSEKKPRETMAMPLHVKHGSEKDESKMMTQEPQQQLSSKGIDFGPFTPALTSKVRVSGDENARETHDWENLASAFRPNYSNQGVNELFSHYVDAWKKWNDAVEEKQKEAAS
ncbi:hypothetical protein Leryth_005653 [Lithospermum erythrorhizon]|nr:hypothetical protein Leryth_005653 [Lithospermum erythrorhizon]